MQYSQKEIIINTIHKRIDRLHVILENEESTALSEDNTKNINQMNMINHIEVENTLYHEAKRELNKLENNLEWIAQDSGGDCVKCHNPIPVRRLLAVPTTRCCVNCEQRDIKN